MYNSKTFLSLKNVVHLLSFITYTEILTSFILILNRNWRDCIQICYEGWRASISLSQKISHNNSTVWSAKVKIFRVICFHVSKRCENGNDSLCWKNIIICKDNIYIVFFDDNLCFYFTAHVKATSGICYLLFTWGIYTFSVCNTMNSECIVKYFGKFDSNERWAPFTHYSLLLSLLKQTIVVVDNCMKHNIQAIQLLNKHLSLNRINMKWFFILLRSKSIIPM